MLLLRQPRPRRPPPADGTIWYMGAKTRLLGDLEAAIGPLLEARGGRDPPLLVDLFAGTGVVGAHFAGRARVLASDAQRYSAALARALLVPTRHDEARLARLLEEARERTSHLRARHAGALLDETRLLEADLRGADVRERYRRAVEADLATHDPDAEAAAGVATACYRDVYFGIEQAVAIDGIRAALEAEEEPARGSYLAALLFAASRATSATAHFAQPRSLRKDSELHAVLARRRISIPELFAARVRWLAQAGARVAHGDRNEVLAAPYEDVFARVAKGEADVVYADPPYTRDHYSRFYHVLEVLAIGRPQPLARDARGCILKGRYPALERRFQSPFSRADTVEREFRRVSALAAERGAALVWSYSRTNGLLLDLMGGELDRFRALLADFYRDVEVHERPLRHSGQGDKNHSAVELIAVCTRPRC